MKTIHLLCGVPGSGKTWVAQQLKDKFEWVPHDDFPVNAYSIHLIAATNAFSKPILAEAPFRISVLIEELEAAGIKVITYYLTGPESLIASRYEARMGKAWPKQHSTNLRRYDARDWDHKGSGEEILLKLGNL